MTENIPSMYIELKADCSSRGWKAACYPFEIGCRGFVATSFHKWLRLWSLHFVYQQEVALYSAVGPPPGGSTKSPCDGWHSAEDFVGIY